MYEELRVGLETHARSSTLETNTTHNWVTLQATRPAVQEALKVHCVASLLHRS